VVILKNVSVIKLFSTILGRVLLGSTVFGWFGWLNFFVFYWEKKTFSVGLLDQLFQPAQNSVETVENDG